MPTTQHLLPPEPMRIFGGEFRPRPYSNEFAGADILITYPSGNYDNFDLSDDDVFAQTAIIASAYGSDDFRAFLEAVRGAWLQAHIQSLPDMEMERADAYSLDYQPPSTSHLDWIAGLLRDLQSFSPVNDRHMVTA